MQSAAMELKAYVSWGYIESDGARLYNSAILVGPDGKLLTSYRKVNLFSSDFLWAKPGDKSAPIIKTELGRMGIVVCRDLRDKIPKNIPRTASSDPALFDGQRVDIVAASTNWGKGGFPATTWMDFVADNKCTLVATNRWGKETNEEEHGEYVQDFGQGGAAIIEPDWTVHIDGLIFRQDCVVTAALGG
jgi:predicted amidohydrolase